MQSVGYIVYGIVLNNYNHINDDNYQEAVDNGVITTQYSGYSDDEEPHYVGIDIATIYPNNFRLLTNYNVWMDKASSVRSAALEKVKEFKKEYPDLVEYFSDFDIHVVWGTD